LVKRRLVHRDISPDQLKGMKHAQYIRDSTEEQRDHFGPDLQRDANQRFASDCGLVDSGLVYEEYKSATSIEGRSEFQRAIADLEAGKYQVLLVADTNRFARDIEGAEAAKKRIAAANGFLVYTLTRMISGASSTATAERIHHILDMEYSEKLSRFVAGGLERKYAAGGSNGSPPLGARHIYVRGDGTRAYGPEPGTIAQRVLDDDRIQVLRALLKKYIQLRSYRKTAQWMNTQGYRTQRGKPFTTASVKEIVRNDYYGPNEVVYFHRGEPDERRRETPPERQIFPEDVHGLWTSAQDNRQKWRLSCGTNRKQEYPLHPVLRCTTCGCVYHGWQRNGARYSQHSILGAACAHPSRVRADVLEDQMAEILNFDLPLEWAAKVQQVLDRPQIDEHAGVERSRLEGALASLRKQHQWGDLDDTQYKREVAIVRQELDALPVLATIDFATYRMAAELLKNVGKIVGHPALRQTPEGSALVKKFYIQSFEKIQVDQKRIVAIHPKAEYKSLFAVVANGNEGWKGAVERT